MLADQASMQHGLLSKAIVFVGAQEIGQCSRAAPGGETVDVQWDVSDRVYEVMNDRSIMIS